MTEEFIRETLDYLKAKLAESLKETGASNQDAFVRAYSLDQLDYELFSGLEKAGISHIIVYTDSKAYGLSWKDKGADDDDVYYKYSVYPWPQYGLVRGAKTSFSGSKDIAQAMKKTIAEF